MLIILKILFLVVFLIVNLTLMFLWYKTESWKLLISIFLLNSVIILYFIYFTNGNSFPPMF